MPRTRFVALLLALVLALGTFPIAAVAEPLPTVPSHAFVGGIDLFGMTAEEASATIHANAGASSVATIGATAAELAYSYDLAPLVQTDFDAMLQQAFETTATEPFALPRRAVVSTAAVASILTSIAADVYVAPIDAQYYLKSGKLKCRLAVEGRALNVAAATTALTDAIAAQYATDTALPSVALPVTVLEAKVTAKNLGRAIIVDISQRRLWLFSGSKLIKTVRVAVGQSKYPTPVGAFRIIRKNPAPTWYNPGSAWAKSMPKKIGPGPRNPLGLRALYLNVSGIRIHGTYKYYSLGHAASHGCIRVGNRDIVKLYPLVPVGTKVYIVR